MLFGRRRAVLVACASAWVSPARLPQVLSVAGARVVALSARGRALAATRFVDRVIEVPGTISEYVDALRAHLETHAYDWVIVADDPLLDALRARRHESWARTLLPIAGDHEWSDVIASKASFCARGAAAGLPIPESRTCGSLEEARAALHVLGAPMLLKQSSGYGGTGVRLVDDLATLDDAWRELSGSGQEIVAQRFVDGPIGNSVFLMDHGRPICWMSAFKVRTFPGPFGPSSARRFMTHEDVEPLLSRLGALTGYHGFGAVDWVLAEDHLQLIELNARPVPTIHMGAHAGVDFARAVRGMLAGAPTVQAPPAPPADAPIYPMFPEDIWRAATENAVDVREWVRLDLPWRDPQLLWHHLAGLYREARKR
jgi:glutathione synthase/RimK-type ligase-like ATP-grasp enzyme